MGGEDHIQYPNWPQHLENLRRNYRDACVEFHQAHNETVTASLANLVDNAEKEQAARRYADECLARWDAERTTALTSEQERMAALEV